MTYIFHLSGMDANSLNIKLMYTLALNHSSHELCMHFYDKHIHVYEVCDLAGSYLQCQVLLADTQELIDTHLRELELINMYTNSKMYYRKKKISLIQQSMTYCVWSEGIHYTARVSLEIQFSGV